ncbi:unnamed protein product [Nezara viridula]|uniref:Neuropeptide n=1 Tax=Nezara viridula TaxID=85310 RepID=A0A9P0MSS7_NEZVI|nr:unnamed protein product [Nezara viridula]
MIISLVAILMLLSDETLEENEIEWFFRNEGNKQNNDKFETQFLGWKMGSAVGMATKTKLKNKTPEPNERRQIDATDVYFPFQSVKTIPTWKTLILADSTIHYIPLEEMVTVRPSKKSFIPDDALDPFYLDTDTQADIFNQEFLHNQYVYKVPTPVTQQQLLRKSNLYAKNNAKHPMMFCPVGLSFQKKLMPFLDPYGAIIRQPLTYRPKSKIEPGLLPELSRHTMFIHPRLLDMMKAMDRSILSFPSKFEYKSFDQLRKSSKQLLPNRYSDKIIV